MADGLPPSRDPSDPLSQEAEDAIGRAAINTQGPADHLPRLTGGVEESGAGDEGRTRDFDLGKVALCQLSYSRAGTNSRAAAIGHACWRMGPRRRKRHNSYARVRTVRLEWIALVAGMLLACNGSASPASPPPASATPPPSSTACSLRIEPEVGAPGGWSVVVGSGFKAGEKLSWSAAAEDGSLDASWDSDGFQLMRPDNRGGFGFGLGSAGEEAIGHTFHASVTSPSCTASASWRVDATNEQTGPLPTSEPAACSVETSRVDRVDDAIGHQVHLIYAIPSDGIDRHIDAAVQIADSFEHLDSYLRARLDGHAFRLDTCDGELDITYLQMPRTGNEYAAMRNAFTQGLDLDLVRMGFQYGQKLYVVAWDGLAQWARLGDGCGGEAGFHGVAVAFLRSNTGETCPRLGQETPIGEPDTGLAHEIIHVLGLPAQCGANVDEGGHVTDNPADLMYGMGHTIAVLIDDGHDDYYGHDIPDCPDLADSAFLDPLPADPQLPVDWPPDAD